MDNRRVYHRLVTRHLVKVTKEDGSEVGDISYIYDLSEGGLRLICHEILDIHTVLNITFYIPEKDKSMNVRAKVLWLLPIKQQEGSYFAGLQFLKRSDDIRGAIHSFYVFLLNQRPEVSY